MSEPREQYESGTGYLAAVTTLLQRSRAAHPTDGLYEAADLQWWWRTPRPTDAIDQLFWFDHLGRPEAAVIATDWGSGVALAPLLLPDAAPDRVAKVVERGLAHAAASGIESVDLEVDCADEVLLEVLARYGFVTTGDGLVETWLAAEARPPTTSLHPDYRLSRRADNLDRPHHMISRKRNHDDVEGRLRQTSLYRPDLDLVIYDGQDNTAAYGLFWFDPETGTGLVEPMRTEDEHQRRGLARHVITAGLDLLAGVGAARIKICFEPDNPPARDLYLDVGFQPVRQTVMMSGSTGGSAS